MLFAVYSDSLIGTRITALCHINTNIKVKQCVSLLYNNIFILNRKNVAWLSFCMSLSCCPSVQMQVRLSDDFILPMGVTVKCLSMCQACGELVT